MAERAALFLLGQVVATPGALALLEEKGVMPVTLLTRHICGDWGDLDDADKAANQHALKSGGRIFSAYQLGADRLWIITDGEDDHKIRQATTLLLPTEY